MKSAIRTSDSSPDPQQTNKTNITRKDFLSKTTRLVTIGTAGSMLLTGSLSGDADAQTPKKNPASIDDKPIVLEQWKSDVDQQSGPVPTPLPPDRRIGYAVVGLGHLSLEEIIPALYSCNLPELMVSLTFL